MAPARPGSGVLQATFFDFDQPVGKQRLVVEGDYANVSQYVFIELSAALKDGARLHLAQQRTDSK